VKAIRIPRTTLKELKKWVSEDSGWDTVAENPLKKEAGSIAAPRGWRNSRPAGPISGTEPQLRYRRHVELVAAAAFGIAAARSFSAHAPLALAFACYGALHAAAVALCLHPRPAPGRALAFVAAAALQSGLLARLGSAAVPLLARGDFGSAALLVVAASAFAGALGYGVLLRWLLRYPVGAAPLVTIASACTLAACGALALTRRFPAGGSTWLAILWWLAFSGGLCVASAGRTRSAPRSAGATEQRIP
jgi:hypothetical protein